MGREGDTTCQEVEETSGHSTTLHPFYLPFCYLSREEEGGEAFLVDLGIHTMVQHIKHFVFTVQTSCLIVSRHFSRH